MFAALLLLLVFFSFSLRLCLAHARKKNTLSHN